MIYHFATTCHLPWILESGRLEPGPNKIGGFPTDFLWATTDGDFCATASAFGKSSKIAFREGQIRLVRFGVDDAEFFDWAEAISRHPEWTPAQVARLERAGRDIGDDPRTWRCRREPLSLDDVVVETRGYAAGRQWSALEAKRIVRADDDPRLTDVRGVVINGRVYGSRRFHMKNGARGYEILPPLPERQLGEIAR